jgi:hypothetical protein
VTIGYQKGAVDHFDEYGRRPWQEDYRKEDREGSERRSFYRFQGEFARLNGPYRRGRGYEFGHDHERDSDDFHEYHLSLEKRKKPKR